MNNIPLELRNLIDSEQTDFIVKSKRNHPKKNAYALLFFSLVWNVFISIFVISFFGPLLKGEELNFTTNNKPTTASIDNWEPIIIPGIMIGFFVIIGIAIFIWSLVKFFQKGGYFVGTETRFIKYRNGVSTIKDWEQFSGNMKVKTKNITGNLELELRTGKMSSSKNGNKSFVPKIIYMSGIKNVYEIEKKCRIRIKENDPTPKVTT